GGHELRLKSLLRHRFAAAGELLEIRDRNDNAMTLSYAGGRLVQVTDTAGRAIIFSYGANGRLASITDPLPRTIQFVEAIPRGPTGKVQRSMLARQLDIS
ncbi:MAG: hypothetical protein MUP13_17970, partial [Thermoanaerobaculales bacterium]|nr:hypothetical protein [Thermoanaerobaculales bacterium]